MRNQPVATVPSVHALGSTSPYDALALSVFPNALFAISRYQRSIIEYQPQHLLDAVCYIAGAHVDACGADSGAGTVTERSNGQIARRGARAGAWRCASGRNEAEAWQGRPIVSQQANTEKKEERGETGGEDAAR